MFCCWPSMASSNWFVVNAVGSNCSWRWKYLPRIFMWSWPVICWLYWYSPELIYCLSIPHGNLFNISDCSFYNDFNLEIYSKTWHLLFGKYTQKLMISLSYLLSNESRSNYISVPCCFLLLISAWIFNYNNLNFIWIHGMYCFPFMKKKVWNGI